MKKEYQRIKEELKKQCSSVKYFTLNWYKMFILCHETVIKEVKEENERVFYIDGGDYKIKLYEAYRPIYESDFYNKNSCAYCQFLSEYYQIEKRKTRGSAA